jgi:hypothetical protein
MTTRISRSTRCSVERCCWLTQFLLLLCETILFTRGATSLTWCQEGLFRTSYRAWNAAYIEPSALRHYQHTDVGINVYRSRNRLNEVTCIIAFLIQLPEPSRLTFYCSRYPGFGNHCFL